MTELGQLVGRLLRWELSFQPRHPSSAGCFLLPLSSLLGWLLPGFAWRLGTAGMKEEVAPEGSTNSDN